MPSFSCEVKQEQLFLGSHLGLSDKPAFTVCTSWESGDGRRAAEVALAGSGTGSLHPELQATSKQGCGGSSQEFCVLFALW